MFKEGNGWLIPTTPEYGSLTPTKIWFVPNFSMRMRTSNLCSLIMSMNEQSCPKCSPKIAEFRDVTI